MSAVEAMEKQLIQLNKDIEELENQFAKLQEAGAQNYRKQTVVYDALIATRSLRESVLYARKKLNDKESENV